MRNVEVEPASMAKKLTEKSHLELGLMGIGWSNNIEYLIIESIIKNEVIRLRRLINYSHKRAQLLFVYNGGDFSSAFWQEDEVNFNDAIESTFEAPVIEDAGKGIKSRNARWIYSTTSFLLVKEAGKEKNPEAKERLKQISRKQILKAIEKTEEIDKTCLERSWIYQKILSPNDLINPNRNELRTNLVIFINGLPPSNPTS